MYFFSYRDCAVIIISYKFYKKIALFFVCCHNICTNNRVHTLLGGKFMEIAAVSSALSAVQSYGAYSTGSLAQVASIKMLDNTMEMSETMNAQLISMMEQSVNPNLGGNIDIRV